MPARFDKPFLLSKSKMRLTWAYLHRASEFGFHRGMYSPVVAQNTSARIIVLPFGQASPVHRSSAEHIHYQISSDVEFEMAGETYVVRPGDLFFIPADVDYRYANVGDADAFFLSVHSRVSDWPPKVDYAE